MGWRGQGTSPSQAWSSTLEEAAVLISDLSNWHSKHILTADYQIKARRNQYVLEKQGGIMEVMLGQSIP